MSKTDMKVQAENHSLGAPEARQDAPEYPYGLRITLNDETLKKLFMNQMPEVGSELSMEATVKVVSVSEDPENGGKENRSVGLQITELGLTKEDEKSDPAKFYGE